MKKGLFATAVLPVSLPQRKVKREGTGLRGPLAFACGDFSLSLESCLAFDERQRKKKVL